MKSKEFLDFKIKIVKKIFNIFVEHPQKYSEYCRFVRCIGFMISSNVLIYSLSHEKKKIIRAPKFVHTR